MTGWRQSSVADGKAVAGVHMRSVTSLSSCAWPGAPHSHGRSSAFAPLHDREYRLVNLSNRRCVSIDMHMQPRLACYVTAMCESLLSGTASRINTDQT